MTETHGATATPERGRPGPTEGKASLPARISLYYRQVVAELRKVIWPTRKELITYTTVVMVFVVMVIALCVGARPRLRPGSCSGCSAEPAQPVPASSADGSQHEPQPTQHEPSSEEAATVPTNPSPAGTSVDRRRRWTTSWRSRDPVEAASHAATPVARRATIRRGRSRRSSDPVEEFRAQLRRAAG